MPSSDLEYGSAAASVVGGILTFIVLGWLSIYGWIAAGLVAGLIARGSLRGTVSAIVSGAIVSGVIIALSILVSPSLITSYASMIGSNQLVSAVSGQLQTLMALQPLILIRTLVIGAIIVPAIGGFIGGSIMKPRKYSLGDYEEEVPESTQ